MELKILPCHCGSTSYYTKEVVFSNGIVNLRRFCNACNAKLEFLPKQDIPPGLHVIHFGKHKGTTFFDLVKNHRDYVDWLLKQDINRALRWRLGQVIKEFGDENKKDKISDGY